MDMCCNVFGCTIVLLLMIIHATALCAAHASKDDQKLVMLLPVPRYCIRMCTCTVSLQLGSFCIGTQWPKAYVSCASVVVADIAALFVESDTR